MNRELGMEIFNAALAAVDPYENVLAALRLEKGKLFVAGTSYDIKAIDRIIIVGAGKASARMAAAGEAVLGDLPLEGVVIAPYGGAGSLRRVELLEASHPVPDQAGVAATQRVLELARKADERTLVLCFLSGGGSALLVAPAQGVELEDKQRTTELLLRSGCSIAELNTVRKHLSAVKGGRLAQAAYPAAIVSLILSDVIGDNLDVIASGPTAPDLSTFAGAAGIIEKYGLRQNLPPRVLSFLERGAAGGEQETAKSDDACFRSTRNMIVGGIAQALSAGWARARALGFNPVVVASDMQGQARDAGRILSQTALRIRAELRLGERRCLLFGGETTVRVHGSGTGGRNQELALAFALGVSGAQGICLLSAGTDGRDGPTDAAGAVVDGATARFAQARGISPEAYLANNDSYTFFARLDALGGEKHHVITGATGTNVMDLQVVLLEG